MISDCENFKKNLKNLTPYGTISMRTSLNSNNSDVAKITLLNPFSKKHQSGVFLNIICVDCNKSIELSIISIEVKNKERFAKLHVYIFDFRDKHFK